jgi:hypothetical protein
VLDMWLVWEETREAEIIFLEKHVGKVCVDNMKIGSQKYVI